ncbi:MAG: hypothetical protein ACFCUR_11265 [Rhodomicrobiaceae bacterium]
MDDHNHGNRKGANGMTRRGMLMRLGLAAGAVYAAPVMLKLSEAKASSVSAGSRSGPSVSGPRKPQKTRVRKPASSRSTSFSR